MAKFKVCIQQYVEQVAAVEVEAATAEEARRVAYAEGLYEIGARQKAWVAGDDAQEAVIYEVIPVEDPGRGVAFEDWLEADVAAFEAWRQTVTAMSISGAAGVFGLQEDEIAGPNGASMLVYDDGFMEVMTDGRYSVVCGQHDIVTADLAEAERFLWEEHAKHEQPYHAVSTADWETAKNDPDRRHESTPIVVREVDGPPEVTTLEMLLAEDDGLAADEDAIRAALDTGETYHGGGGAAPEFTIAGISAEPTVDVTIHIAATDTTIEIDFDTWHLLLAAARFGMDEGHDCSNTPAAAVGEVWRLIDPLL
jgi:hypothetical protein